MIEERTPVATARLDAWISEHGPLGSADALLLGLEVCVAVSRLPPSSLRRVVESIDAGHVERGPHGWKWSPGLKGSPAGQIRESDIAERVGMLLFYVLTGLPPSAARFAELRARAAIAGARPDLPPEVSALVARALDARVGQYRLAALSQDLRRALGIGAPGLPLRWKLAVSAAGACVVTAFGVWQMTTRTEHVESWGLTATQTALADTIAEEIQGMALVDEHTYAVSRHQALMRALDPVIAPQDPRRSRAAASEAWIRTLAGDWFTTEQILSAEVGRIEQRFGRGHPYWRAAMLHLALAVEARGQAAAAARLRETATALATRALGGFGPLTHSGTESPAMVGVIAHVDPNRPEHEGFRRGDDGSYGAPLTSLQRYFAGRDGWTLRIRAAEACRSDLAIGSLPQRVTVTIDRHEDRRARLRVDGVLPTLELVGDDAEYAHVVVTGNSSGAVTATLGAVSAVSRLDLTREVAVPPYTLSYRGPSTAGCQAVWLEIPVPNSPNGSIGRPFTR
jgi:hypothetical protein